LALAAPLSARAQVVELAPRATVFLEPSSSSKLIVINPHAELSVTPTDWLELHAGYEADIVSGATESLKGGRLSPVDIVSSATNFKDTRHVISGGFGLARNDTKLMATYSRGMESDYRSHAFSVTAGTSFLQKNTELTVAYGRGFDEVCTTAFADSDSASVRAPLDSSDGCFENGDNRARRDVDLDNFQSAWTQTWSPVFATQVIGYASLQRASVAQGEHPMSGGSGRVRLDKAADYAHLRRDRFGCDLVPLPQSLTLSPRDEEINRRAKLPIAG